MTQGSISKLLLFFCLPLILGNMFQVLYNTVDTMVVGNFVGKEALAAVSATSPMVNIAVFSFNGISIGAGVVIGQYFGARDQDQLHRSIETTMALTFILSVVFTVVGVLAAPWMMRLISTPDDVMGPAVTYLQIYFAGISGLLVYNMGSGILRAVGDSTRPLIFLIIASLTNIVLDLLFVVGFGMGIAGAAVATILSQFLSAGLVLVLLIRADDVYRYSLRETAIDGRLLRRILSVGLPAGFQSMITAFANGFVQAYINAFGSAVMAGWGCYNKLDQVMMLPVQSMGHASATFVSQNIGAGREERANRGTFTAAAMITGFNFVCASLLTLFARPAVSIFTSDRAVIDSGVAFIRTNSMFFVINGINHALAGSMRGRGDARAPMYIMLFCFVGIRQLYLFVITRLFNDSLIVAFGYPVGWISCAVILGSYYYRKYFRGGGTASAGTEADEGQEAGA